MSARGKARKQALDFLYESDIRGVGASDLLRSRKNLKEVESERPIREYAEELVIGVSLNQRKIDELIATYSQGWDMDRLATVDRNILRLAIYEIVYCDDIADGIAIDEALLLAKDLSSEDSSTFIHGVLGKISAIKESIAR